MTIAQYQKLLELSKSLKSNSNFVHSYLNRLGKDLDLSDTKQKTQYLELVWKFVSGLEDSFRNEKASVLYNILAHQRSQGIYNKEMFLEYFKMPKSSPEYESVTRGKTVSKVSLGTVVGDLPSPFTDSELVR